MQVNLATYFEMYDQGAVCIILQLVAYERSMYIKIRYHVMIEYTSKGFIFGIRHHVTLNDSHQDSGVYTHRKWYTSMPLQEITQLELNIY